MGKIFDALEKTDRQHSGKTSFIKVTKPKVHKESVRERVVHLTNKQDGVTGNTVHPNLVDFHAPQSLEAEIFKMLRTNILFPVEGTRPKTILVTSALPGEGKSLVCANLAISIARGIEDHVILIDCDIRKPTSHSLFGFAKVPGLSEYLASKQDISDLLLKTAVPKLTLFPGGNPPMNPAELISSQKMKALLDEVRNRYDDRIIMIDSPPSSLASETNAIAQYVDGVIIVVKAGHTPQRAVQDVIEAIGKEKIIGVVLNYSDKKIKKYYSYGGPYSDNQ